jgi:predicted transcriptional regulator
MTAERAAYKKRHRLEVIYDFLRIIREHRNSIRPTPLLRLANLSTGSFSEYCDELTLKGFIKTIDDKDGKYLTLTDKGFKYLEKYRLVLGLLDEFGL